MFPSTSLWARSLLGSLSLLLSAQTALAAIAVQAPASAPGSDANVVYSNFLGLSLELSFINYYFGNSTDQIPQPVVNYLSSLHAHGSGKPVRIRLGGNSMDSSTYVPGQKDIIEFTDPNANWNDQPVNYGPQLFDVMKGVSSAVGGAQYLIGLSLRTPNNTNIPLLAGDATKALGGDLDAFLLGNEPDLYTGHGQRPNLANYTVNDYIGDYWVVFNNLKNTPQGDVLSMDNIAGPTICCAWDLASVLESGWMNQFMQQLKYITLQHYPQNNCFGKPAFGIEYYLVHSNTVDLAKWQSHGLQIAALQKKPVLMDEFNSISCGGVAGISDTFGAAMWTSDYALQMAVQGYAGAYLHSRERGVTYNLFDPPDAVAGAAGAWTTNPSYYGMLPVSEALESADGSRVVDLNIKNSVADSTATSAGYAIYDGASPTVHSLVIFNYKNTSGETSDYALDGALIPADKSALTIRYLAAGSVNEKTEIAWGGKTYAGVGDGVAVDASFAASVPDKTVACPGGCTIQVPGPGIAVVFLGGQTNSTTGQNNGSAGDGSSTGKPSSGGNGGTNGARKVDLFLSGLVGVVVVGLLFIA
ncbi:glycoside hydrolase family 79 protein [Daedaleopsis nitida]|nr:glycoside hydrolase family 79 protein [Daedaleopsis nitida]